MAQNVFRDLLYFDFDKASSILSQFDWGLIEQISITQDEIKNQNSEAKVGIQQIAGVGFGIDKQKKTSILETKKIHHDLLNRVESQLSQIGLITDLSTITEYSSKLPDEIRQSVDEKPYIKARGWSVIEDYQRILSTTSRLNEIMNFFNKTQSQSIKSSKEYQDLLIQKELLWNDIKTIKDPNQQKAKKFMFKSLEDQLESITKNSAINTFEPWQIEGIQTIIDTFVSNRINFRVYPFEDKPQFHIMCNLKRDNFVDQNLEHLLYGYGKQPNIKLTVLGLITSIPKEEASTFDPMSEFLEDISKNKEFEKGLRQLFGLMDGFESMVSFSRYPIITIHPIAVFREFHYQNSQKQESN